MAEYFVRSDGDDNKSGRSDAEAWRTKSKVNAQAFNPIEDKIFFKGGNVWIGAPLSPLLSGIFGAYGDGEPPRFDMSIRRNIEADWIVETPNLWYATSGNYEICNLIMDNEGIIGTRKTSKTLCVAPGDWWWDNASRRIYLYSGGNPATVYHNDIICAQKLQGILVDCTLADKAFLTFQDIDVAYSGFHAFHIDGHSHNPDNILFERCRAYWTGSYDLAWGGNAWEIWGRGTNITIRSCRADQSWDFFSAVESNVAGTMFSNIRIYDNLGYKNGGGFGFFHNQATGTTIGLYVEHNTFTDGTGAWSTPHRHDAWWVNGIATSNTPGTINGIYFRHNIIDRFSYRNIWFDTPLGPTFICDYNCYNKPLGGSKFRLGVAEYNSLAAWRAASGQDTNSIDADPLFVDSTNADFHLTKDSPCIGIDAGAFKYIGEIMATHSIDVILRVLELADFAMGATPADLSVQRTKTGTYSVTATAVGGFATAITLSVSGVPTNASFSFSKNQILPGETSVFSITPAANTPLGNFTLSFTGNG